MDLLNLLNILKKETQGNCPRLTHEQEVDLVARIKEGDVDARDELFMSCVPMAIKQATSWYVKARDMQNYGIEVVELVQIALCGLLNSINLFDPAKSKFTTYAHWHIWSYLMRCTKNQGVIHIPHCQYGNYDPTNPATQPIQPLVHANRDDGGQAAIIVAEQREYDHKRIRKAMLLLPDREQEIIDRRYWQKDTLQTIANDLGITRERVRQLQQRAERRLACYLAEESDLQPEATGSEMRCNYASAELDALLFNQRIAQRRELWK